MAIDRTADGPRLVRYRRNAAWFYIVAAYAIAWTGVWLIVSPYGFPGSPEALNKVYGIAFVAMAAGPGLVALRLLIVWLYERTGSVLIAQLAHASYSGGLMILWPVTSSPEQVIAWTGAFAFVLLAVAAAICRFVPRRV